MFILLLVSGVLPLAMINLECVKTELFSKNCLYKFEHLYILFYFIVYVLNVCMRVLN